MINRIYLCCLLLLGLTALSAQTFTVEGQVTFTDANVPLPGHPVGWLTDDAPDATTVTDDNGFYSLSITTDAADISLGTFDPCTGALVELELAINPNQANYLLDIHLCEGIDPPNPPDTCIAFFFNELLPNDDTDGYLMHFFNVSFASAPIVSTIWDFGDGTTSTESDPLHHYAEAGTYTVTLTIVDESGCTATYIQDVVVQHTPDDCDCPEDVYAPVCVVTSSGAFLSFDNSCYAACAGFGPDQYFPCDGGCGCPEIYDPVCVDTATGDTIQFDNACEAECAGFAPDQWYHCGGDCACADGDEPVCVATPYGVITFPNICVAEEYGYADGPVVDCVTDVCDCPDIYDPVCVLTPIGPIEFPNACIAACEGFGPDSYVDCEGDDCICPDIYDPVCVLSDGGDTLTFANACYAACAGYANPDTWVSCDDACVCPDVYDPVCIETDWGQISFPNSCYAECAGFTEEDYDSCDDDDCNCPLIFDPVCVDTPSGEILTFPNGCFAECEGYSPDQYYNCTNDCDCPDIYDPVCVQTTTGVIDFPNSCYAECAGFTAEDVVDCEDGNDCDCFLLYDPVCIDTPDGETLTFPNACFAECEGFTADMYYECDEDGECDCPDVFDPVCVATPSGQILTFPNACYAECEGFAADVYYSCDGNNGCDCDDVYDPVCVVTTAGILTFPNSCYAECEGYTDADYIDCDDCDCSAFFGPPVCVATGAEILTFPNACYAECAGYSPDDYYICDGNSSCDCPEYALPVCILTPGGDTLTFDNPCFAVCAGFEDPFQWINCQNPDDCICPDVWDPVCVQTGAGVVQFGNACEAACFGFADPNQFVSCEDDCGCPDEYDPVCVVGFAGLIQFDNPCLAFCAGFTEDLFVDCDNDCNCDDEYDPVCVQPNPAGPIIFFDNACLAECAGYGADQFIDCDTDCWCPPIDAPVCVPTECGPIVFPNACVAACEGFSPDEYYYCDGPVDLCQADFFTEIIDPATGLVLFQDISVTQSPIYHWLWDFGDGTTGEGPTVEHHYAEAGVYDVTLTILADGCESTITHHICIGEDGGVDGQSCQALYLFSQETDNLLTFHFTDLSFGDITSWHWDFGDGATSTETHPAHTYDAAGVYLVTLTIETANCQSSMTLLLTVGEDIVYGQECMALFVPIIEPDSLNVFFLNLSGADAVSFAWDYGDGTTDSGPFAYHEYAAEGTYEVTLTITTADGCTSSFTVVLDLTDDNFVATPPYSIINSTDEPVAQRQISLSPNPTNALTEVQIVSTTTDELTVELLDLQGRPLQVRQESLRVGVNSFRFDLSSYPAGVYLVRVRDARQQQTLRLVKTE